MLSVGSQNSRTPRYLPLSSSNSSLRRRMAHLHGTLTRGGREYSLINVQAHVRSNERAIAYSSVSIGVGVVFPPCLPPFTSQVSLLPSFTFLHP